VDVHTLTGIGGVTLVFGLGTTAIAAIACALRRCDPHLPWAWLSLFGLLQAVAAWIGLLGFPLALGGVPSVVRIAAQLASYLALLEFARRGLQRASTRRLPRGLLIPFVLLAATTFYRPAPWPFDAHGSALALLAFLASAAATWWVARRLSGPPALGLRASGVLLLLFGAARLAEAPQALAWAPTMAEWLALPAAGALLLYALWDSDRASGRGPQQVRRVLGLGGLLLTAATLTTAALLAEKLLPAEPTSPPHWPVALVAVLTGVSIGGLLMALLTGWREALDWAKRVNRQDLDLLGPIVEATRDGLLVVDESGEVVFRNSRFAIMWGVAKRQLDQRDAATLWDHLLDQLIDPALFRHALEQTRSSKEEYRDVLRFSDGRVFQVYSCPMPSDSDIAGRAWSFKDITGLTSAELERRSQRTRLQRENEALARLSRRRFSQAGDLDEALAEITEAAAETFAVEYASVWLLDEDAAFMRCADSYQRSLHRHASGAAERAEDYPDLSRALEETERTLAVEEMATDPRVQGLRDSQLVPEGAHAVIAAPIRLDGEVAGFLLAAHVGGLRHWSTDEEQFFGSLTDYAALGIEWEEHRQTEHALQRIHEVQQLIIDTAATAVFLTDGDGRITVLNEAFCSSTGYLPEELIGRHYSALAGDCSEDCPLTRGSEGGDGRIMRHTCQLRDREKGAMTVTLNVAPVLDATGRRLGRIFSFTDVSEVSQARDRVDQVLRESESARKELVQARERIEALEAQREQLQARMSEVEAERAELTGKLKTEEPERARLRRDLDRSQAELERARERAERLIAELHDSSLELKEERAKHEELQASLATSQGEREDWGAWASEIQNERDRLRDELQEARGELEQVRAEIATQAQRETALQAERDALQAELEAERAERTSAVDQAQSEAADVTAELQEVRAASIEAEGARKRAQSEAAQALARVEEVQQKLRAREAAEAQAAKEAAALRVALDEAQAETAEARAEAEEAKAAAAEERAAIEQERAEARQQLTTLADREASLEELQAALAQQRARVDALERERGEEDVRRSAWSAERDQLTTKLADWEQRYTELEERLQEQGAAREQMQAQLERRVAEWEAERARLQQGLAEKDEERVQLEQRVTVAETQREELEQRRHAGDAEYAELKSRHAELEERAAELAADRADTQARQRTEAAEARSQLSAARVELAEARQKIARLEEQVRAGETASQRAAAQGQASDAQQHELQAQLQEARASAEQGANRIAELEQELEAAAGLQGRLEALAREQSSAREQVEARGQELERLRAELDAARSEVATLKAQQVDAPASPAASPPPESEPASKPVPKTASAHPTSGRPQPRAEQPLKEVPPPPGPVAGAAAPFDPAQLLERVGGDRGLAVGRARAFQKGSAWMLTVVRQALVRKDPRALASAAQSLRGALADVTAGEAERLAGELEAMGRRQDLQPAQKALHALEREIERVRRALGSFERAA